MIVALRWRKISRSDMLKLKNRFELPDSAEWDSVVYTKYERIIAVDCYEFFKEGDLVILQKEIMKILSEKEITIETMPTSNVTIGHHHSFRSYHLARWMRWKEESNIPNIVMGTDETGVFPTNIKNEYANVYDLLVQNNGLSDDEKEKAKRFVNSIFDKSREKAFCAPIT